MNYELFGLLTLCASPFIAIIGIAAIFELKFRR